MIRRYNDEEDIERLDDHDGLWVLRQVMNVIFIIGALAGMYLYYKNPEDSMGIVIIISAMAIKVFECALRILKVNKNRINKYKRKDTEI